MPRGRTKGAKNRSPWCPGSNQPHCGECCEYCGRYRNTQHKSIIIGGMAQRHVALSSRQLEGRDRHRK